MFELPALTQDGGSVEKIIRYDAEDYNTQFLVWDRKDPVIRGAIGSIPDLKTPLWGYGQAPTDASPDS
jgi:hypothetical protein